MYIYCHADVLTLPISAGASHNFVDNSPISRKRVHLQHFGNITAMIYGGISVPQFLFNIFIFISYFNFNFLFFQFYFNIFIFILISTSYFSNFISIFLFSFLILISTSYFSNFISIFLFSFLILISTSCFSNFISIFLFLILIPTSYFDFFILVPS